MMSRYAGFKVRNSDEICTNNKHEQLVNFVPLHDETRHSIILYIARIKYLPFSYGTFDIWGSTIQMILSMGQASLTSEMPLWELLPCMFSEITFGRLPRSYTSLVKCTLQDFPIFLVQAPREFSLKRTKSLIVRKLVGKSSNETSQISFSIDFTLLMVLSQSVAGQT